VLGGGKRFKARIAAADFQVEINEVQNDKQRAGKEIREMQKA
jgi:hypothetical protein